MLDSLRALMRRFCTDALVHETPAAFRQRIDAFLAVQDHRMEGFDDPARQRDLSIRFHWGHDHDFGDFALKGRMGERHLILPALFMDELHALPASLAGKRVLDIGCWTGGMSLLLVAMGAEVVAIEEVRKYVECVQYLAHAFGVEDRLAARHQSLYDLPTAGLGTFDLVMFCGVVYHVTDPVLAMRHVFNVLRDGGTCLLETQMCEGDGALLEYWGPRRFGTGSAERLDRSGWNWLVPSEPAVRAMMEDVGFTGVRTLRAPNSRLLAAATREQHVDMLRAGLSVKGIG